MLSKNKAFFLNIKNGIENYRVIRLKKLLDRVERKYCNYT